MLVVLIGKTASGKDTIAQNLAMKHGFHSVVRYTTRPRRKGEKQGVNYHYISDDEFKQKISENFFLEYQPLLWKMDLFGITALPGNPLLVSKMMKGGSLS